MPRLESALDRARKELTRSDVFELAQVLYRRDKGNEFAQLRSLRQECQAVYLADALVILTDEDSRVERIKRIHMLDAQVFALADDENESVMRQARRDMAHYGPKAVR